MSPLIRQPRHVRRWTTALNAASVLVVAGAMCAGLRSAWPLPAWTPPQLDQSAPEDGAVEARPALTLAELAVIWQRDLHQAVVDAPPPKPAARPPEPKLSIRLVGTAVESDHCFGMFRLANGRTVVKAVGTTVAGFEIVAVERGKAQLRRDARLYELRVPWYDRLAAALEDDRDVR